MELKQGDKVKHKTYKHFGIGEVKEIAKSGKRARVKFPDSISAYYRIDLLEPIQGEGEKTDD
jgi:hypothetical protein